MKKLDAELLIGLGLLLTIGALIYFSLHRGQISFGGPKGYTIQAEFSTAGGLQKGAVVELAGVDIGRVTAVNLTNNYRANVTMKILPTVALQEDTRAAIKSKGLIGERYVDISPGKATDRLQPGGHIRDTESPVDIQETIAKFIFGNVESTKNSSEEIQ
jgi:phospholipid/cholesterol/gamma-HCH transport system substrate-binding protein